MYDEQVKALRICEEGQHCDICPKWPDKQSGGMNVCQTALLKEAADAIEALNNIVEQYKLYLQDAIKDLQSAHKELSRWIPVTERLPKEADGMVFVLMPDVFPYNSKQPFVNCNQDRRIDMAHYSEHSKTWYFGDCGAVGGQEPIAWIHRNALPEPPKEES